MRRFDWQSRLAAVLKAKRRDKFEWGRNDCCLFVCEVIEALTGNDLGVEFRGRYNDRAGAMAIVEENGGVVGIAERFARERGYPEVKPVFAQKGDVGLVTTEFGEALGVCDGTGFLYLTIKGGLRSIPLSGVARTWRI